MMMVFELELGMSFRPYSKLKNNKVQIVIRDSTPKNF